MSAAVWTPSPADPGLSCPGCGAWPFDSEASIAEHAALWHPAVRLFSLVDGDEGYVRLHWRCTEAEALAWGARYAYAGDLLVGRAGRTLHVYNGEGAPF